jgi:hypothetical protein
MTPSPRSIFLPLPSSSGPKVVHGSRQDLIQVEARADHAVGLDKGSQLLVAPLQRRLAAADAHHSVDPGQELLGIEGLRQVVVRPQPQAERFALDRVDRRGHDDRYIAQPPVRLGPRRHLVPIHARNHYVQKDQIDRPARLRLLNQHLEGLVPRVGNEHVSVDGS